MMTPIHGASTFDLSQVHALNTVEQNSRKVASSINEIEAQSSQLLNDIISREKQNAQVDAKIESKTLPIGEFFQDKRKPFYNIASNDIMQSFA